MAVVEVPDVGGDVPIVPAFAADGWFVFRCPACEARDRRHRLRLFQLLPCAECDQLMRVAPPGLYRKWQEEREALARRLQRAVARLRQQGVAPPCNLLISGVTTCGKTVYLTMLYQALLRGDDVITGRADSGLVHRELLENYAHLARGEWLKATLDNLRFEARVRHANRRLSLGILDFSGERFCEVYFEQRVETRQHEEITAQVRDALGAVLLIDPQQLDPAEEAYDHRAEFTALEILDQLEARGRAEHAVIAFTKRNATGPYVRDRGGPLQFLSACSPRLFEQVERWRTPVLHIEAVGVEVRLLQDGECTIVPLPRGAANLREAVSPIRALLNRIDPIYLDWLADFGGLSDGAAAAL